LVDSLTEVVLEPELPILDSHHHLWDWPHERLARLPPLEHGSMDLLLLRLAPRYLFNDLLDDLRSGHNVGATVYMECGAMYRANGPEALRCVGETEHASCVAAMAASGTYGPVRACAGIVGGIELRAGADVEDVLQSHIAAGHGRFRGVRQSAAFDEDPNVLGPLHGRAPPGLYRDVQFRCGFAVLHKLGLSFDAWLLEPQLPDLIDLARAFPQTRIILDHVGTPLGVGRYAGQLEARFDIWCENIWTLAKSGNVYVKLGGLAMPFLGWHKHMDEPADSSETLARQWRPYLETCIEAFGPQRCMFESNFPVDRFGASYVALWNAFKRVTAGASSEEKAALFSGTAKHVYDLDLGSLAGR
jgi:L-fuconolactonase